ncbi:potassium transporter Kup [Anaeromyxobacter paludicola]|uniref:Probable potassium transport system protein Kup n=1 Tax=Anaeromyxobacter paludicola TaxID=2918171 RepID=A0ABM7XFM4_9BACT|nr:KUP/HAK/KT family potassium transporter [Anaeromyxobacter paludicola]BDG10676.1 putative potassium transport system protein kup 1 [Anaeromyxobacter paludicola]
MSAMPRRPPLPASTAAGLARPDGATVRALGAEPTEGPAHPAGHGHGAARGGLAALALGALGVVYGDIGTSPLYALKECFDGVHGVAPTPANVMGVLSLVFWAMTFVVTFKYLSLVMRADNRGEGGILALMALVGERETTSHGRRTLLVLGLFGAALLYGDGVITPAISVLGAVEGVAVAAPAFEHVVVPAALLILVALFWFQQRGTATIGAVFGPVMLLWFLCIALLGLHGIARNPSILAAASPHHALAFIARHRVHGFLVLGAVVLVITGGEALYADMGHFGRRPIRLAWLLVAMPALLLNYFGQGALLLGQPDAARNPFYLLAPGWALGPLIGIASAAAVVASQALISGAFSLTHQAVQLGYSPRVTIRHTSTTEAGQIYIPEVNWAVGVATLALVLGFRSSSNLAAAYGIAVTGTMMITTLLFHRVARDRWQWSRLRTWPLTVLLLSVDVSFFAANVVKVEEGGWFPLAAGATVFALMSTWKRGREAMRDQLKDAGLPLDLFLPELARNPPVRVPGTAVFMSSDPHGVPPVLLHHLKHNKVLHERVLFVSVLTDEIPAVPERERLRVSALGSGVFQVIGRYGFMETPNVPALLAAVPPSQLPGPRIDASQLQTTYYLGRETILPTGAARLARWRKRLFIVMSRNSQPASAFFGLPPNRVVEMGAQIQL